MNDVETFYLIEVPGGDRRYIERNLTPERYRMFKAQKEGTRIFKIRVKIPDAGKNCDKEIKTSAITEAQSYLDMKRAVDRHYP